MTTDLITPWFEARGLPTPYIPAALGEALAPLDDTAFSTRPLDIHPIWIPGWLDELRAGPVADYAVVAHKGMSGSKVAVHVFVAIGPLAVFLQMPWGAYGDEAQQREGMRWAMETAEPFIRAAEARAGERRRWALVLSAYEKCGWQKLPEGRWHGDDEPYLDELRAKMGID